jgi:peptidoglycan/LPS O-acetylase OafA/YrhL
VPVDLKSFGQSLAAATLFSSNIYFFFKSGYFDPLAITKPLLHTWSLGVEEQFYIFFPLFMVASFKYLKEKVAIILHCFIWAVVCIFNLAGCASAGCCVLSPILQSLEFAIGSIAALACDNIFKTQVQRKIISLLSVLLLFVPMFTFTEQTSFPGVNALFPCLGAGLLIYLHRTSRGFAFDFLASRPVVFVGKISYSVYLVHWPLVVFLQYVLLRKLDGIEVLLYLFVVIVAGWLSWRYVEEPFRHKGSIIFSDKVFYPALVVVSTVFVMIGVASHVYSGFPSRLSPQARIYADAALDTNPMREQCDSPSVARIARDEVCRVGNPQALPNFVFIGDSFGDALVPGIDAATNRLSKPTAGYALTHSGCFPLPGVEQLSNPSCKGVMDANIAFIKRHPEIRKIVMVARWTSAALGNRFGQFEQSGWVIKDKYSTGQSVNDNKGVMLRSLENLISQFPDRQFIL